MVKVYEKYLEATPSSQGFDSWGIKLVKKTTYYGATSETFIQSPMINHYPSQKDGSQRLRMAHL